MSRNKQKQALTDALNNENDKPLTPAQQVINKTLETATGGQQPKKPVKERKTAQLSCLIYPSVKRELEEIAEYNEISLSQLVNVVLRDYANGNFKPLEIDERFYPIYNF